MKTEQDIKGDVYTLLRERGLSGIVDGNTYRHGLRPLASTDEDIVISVLASDMSSERQTAIVNVNIYVRDLHLESGEAVENGERLGELCRVFAEGLERATTSEYRIILERQSVLSVEGKDEHCINNRLLYSHIHERK